MIALGAGIAGTIAARSIMLRRTADRALVEGMAAYERGDFADAMTGLGAYVARDKSNAKALLALADSRRNVPVDGGRHLVSALAFARAAAQAAPDDPAPLQVIVDLCVQLTYKPEALDAAQKLLALQPDNLRALEVRTGTLASLGRTREALESALDLVRRHPHSVSGHDAVLQLRLDLKSDPRQIREEAAPAIAEHSQDVGFALFGARVEMSAPDSDSREAVTEARKRAIAAVRHASTLPIRNRDDLVSLIRYLDIASRLTRDLNVEPMPSTDSVFARALADPSLARDAGVLKAERAWKFGQPDVAKQAFTAAGGFTDASIRELGVRAIVLDEPKSTSDVLAELERRRSAEAKPSADQKREAEYWLGVLKGRDRISARQFPQAAEELAAACKADPGAGYAQYCLGEALFAMRDWRAAAEQFVLAANTDPCWRTARAKAVTLLTDIGRFDEARRLAAEAYDLQQLLPEAVQYANVLVAMLEAGRVSTEISTEVFKVLGLVEEQLRDDAGLAALRARALLATGNQAEANAAIERLFSLPEPPPPDSLFRLAARLRLSNDALSKRLESLALKSGSNSAAVVATNLAATGRVVEAEAILKEAIAKSPEPDRTRLTLQLGLILDTVRDPGARAVLLDLAKANPSELGVQLAVLQSEFAWSSEADIIETLDRIRAISGERTVAWRVNECRRLMKFSKSEANASKVVADLVPLLRDDPANAQAAIIVANAYLLLKDPGRAIDSLQLSVNADPLNPAAYPFLVFLLQENGRPDDSRQRLAAFRLIKNLATPVLRQRAQLFANQGMRDAAMEDWKELASRGAADDRRVYAIELGRSGDTAQADVLFDQLLSEEAPSAASVVAAADFVSTRDGLDAGLQVLNRLPADLPPDDNRKIKAALFAKHKNFAEAEKLLVERTASNSGAAWADLAEFYHGRGQSEQARVYIEKGLAADPREERLLWLSGITKLGEENSAGLAELVAAASGKDAPPELADILKALQTFGKESEDARVAADDARLAAARAALIGSLEALNRRYPTSFRVWQQLVNAYWFDRQLEKAATAAVTAAQVLPADPRAAQLACNALDIAGRTAEAQAAARKWREITRGDVMAVEIVQARLSFKRDQAAEALKLLQPWKEKILESKDSSRQDAELLATCLAATGQVAEAAMVFGEQHRSDADWGVRYFRVGGTLAGKPDVARAWIASAPPGENAPGDLQMAAGQAWYKIGLKSGKLGDFEQAATFAKRATADSGTSGPAFSLLGAAFLATGKNDLAIEAYRSARKQLPEDPDVANNLAYLLASAPGASGFTEAIELAESAVAIAQRQGLPGELRVSYWDTLGFTNLRQGKLAEAEAAFESGLKIGIDSPELVVGLAEAKLGLGKKPEAAALAKQADLLVQKLGSNCPPDLRKRLEVVRSKTPS